MNDKYIEIFRECIRNEEEFEQFCENFCNATHVFTEETMVLTNPEKGGTKTKDNGRDIKTANNKIVAQCKYTYYQTKEDPINKLIEEMEKTKNKTPEMEKYIYFICYEKRGSEQKRDTLQLEAKKHNIELEIYYIIDVLKTFQDQK